jgi:hypothetical protein
VSRGCHVMNYGKDLIWRGASTTCTPAMTAVIFANLRGTVSTPTGAAASIFGCRKGDAAAPPG